MGRTSPISDIEIAKAWQVLNAEGFAPSAYALREFFRSNARRQQIGLPATADPAVPSYGRIKAQLERIHAQLHLGRDPADPSQPASARDPREAVADIDAHLQTLVRPFAEALYEQAEQRARRHEAALVSLREDQQVLEQQLAVAEAAAEVAKREVGRMEAIVETLQRERDRDSRALEQARQEATNAWQAKESVDALLAQQHREARAQTKSFTQLLAKGAATEATLRGALAQLDQTNRVLQLQVVRAKLLPPVRDRSRIRGRKETGRQRPRT